MIAETEENEDEDDEDEDEEQTVVRGGFSFY